MKKVKTINDRPMIAMRSNTTKWSVRQDMSTGDFYLTRSNSNVAINVKEETRTSGTFTAFGGKWGYDSITCSGKIKSSWEMWKHPEPANFNSVDEIFDLIREKHFDFTTNSFAIKRTVYQYINGRTLETTKDINVAKTWFPGEKPLWLNSVSRQQVGIWVDKKGDHAEVSFWYNNEISKTKVSKWEKAKRAGFWLYPDGTISHFWKGKVFGNRKFEEKRVNYRSFDHRFEELEISQYNFIDLRCSDASVRTAEQFLLCPETLKILKDLGFPTTYWSWGDNTQFPIRRTYDLINFIHYKQQKQISKASQPINDLLEQAEFDINDVDNLVQTFNKGLLVRIPGILSLYEDASGTIAAETWNLNRPKVKSMEIIEKYRIWIKNNGTKTMCFKIVHAGKDWVNCPYTDLHLDASQHSYESIWTTDDAEKWHNLADACKAALSSIFIKVQEQLPVLQYYTGQISFKDLENILNFLSCVQKAPRLVDTLVKTGYIDLIKHNSSYYHREFELETFLRIYGMDLSEYKEKKGQRLWKNLGVTKEQFYFGLEYQDTARDIFGRLRDIPLVQPVKVGVPMFNPDKQYSQGDIVQFHGEMYCRNERQCDEAIPPQSGDYWDVILYPRTADGKTILENIPMKYINLFAKCTKNSYVRTFDITRLMSQENITLTDLETIIQRNLNITLLADYYNILHNTQWYTDTPLGTGWIKIPKDQATLKQLHDEANLRLELVREEYYAKEQRKRAEEEASRAVRYKKYLKQLADFAMEDDKYTVVIPQTLSEIINEGTNMHHCVGSYTGQVANGETFVFFLREKTNVDQCFVTFNICPSNKGRRSGMSSNAHKWCMDQAFAAHDQKPSKEAITFIRQWCEKNDVEFNTILRQCI